MTLKELKILLETTGLPIAYRSFKASKINPIPEPPYIVYLFIDSDNFSADNKVYLKKDNVLIELYTEIKDLSTEQTLEDALDSANIFYYKNETYIESESLYQISYSINI